MVKIISWNVNGLRSVSAKGMLPALSRQRPDVVCFQEVKARQDQVGRVLPRLTHQHFFPSERAGYAGTAVLSRIEPLSVRRGIGRPTSDSEGRVLTVELPRLFVVSAYAPNSQRGLPRLPYRLQWEGQFRRFLTELSRRKPVVFCGDLNVAHQDIDIARPAANRMNAGFTAQERRSFTRLLGAGFVDSFRHLHPDTVEYTWWSYATGARARDIGWRIDYVCLSRELAVCLREAFILGGIGGSDHCPVGVTLDGEP
jgi:exodeoxyribonuclease III